MKIPRIPKEYSGKLPLVREQEEDSEITVYVNDQALFTMTNDTIDFHTSVIEEKTSAGQRLHFEV